MGEGRSVSKSDHSSGDRHVKPSETVLGSRSQGPGQKRIEDTESISVITQVTPFLFPNVAPLPPTQILTLSGGTSSELQTPIIHTASPEHRSLPRVT